MANSPQKAMVMGVHSFINNDIKVGSQFIAEGLAEHRWQVDYLSIFSSPFDLYGSQRRRRLRRVWLEHQDRKGVSIRPGLTEYAFRAPFPAHKSWLRYQWQMTVMPKLCPSWLKKKHYDVCILDVTANIIYLPWVRRNFTVLRLNDLPEGFSYALSAHVISAHDTRIRSRCYDDIWSAHEPLTRHVLDLNPTSRVITIPNGVDETLLTASGNKVRKPKSAVYLGSVEQWVDLELLDKTASLLPEWRFEVIGPLNRPWSVHAPNLKLLPPVAREKVLETLSQYQVGVIPFQEISGRLGYVERPLKFFEYIGAGLGVASTDVGALKSGMGDYWVSYGNTPQAFVEAITHEAGRAADRSAAERREFIGNYSWKKIMERIDKRLIDLQFAEMKKNI